MIRRLIKNKFIKNSLIYVSGSFAIGALNYIFHFVLSRRLSISEYGELQSLLAIFTILGFLAQAVSYLVIKYTAAFAREKDYQSNQEFIGRIGQALWKYGSFVFLAVALLSPLASRSLGLSSPFGFIFSALAAFISILAVVYSSNFMSWNRFSLNNAVGLWGALGKLFFGVIIAWFFPQAFLVSISLVISASLGWLLARMFFGRNIALREKSEGIGLQKTLPYPDIRKAILPIAIFSLLMVLVQNVDLVLVKRLVAPETAGYYSALSLLGKLVLWINLAVIGVILPEACASYGTGKKLSGQISGSAYLALALTSLAFFIAYYLFPDQIITLFFGAKYLSFSSDLWLFAILSFLLSALILEANIAYARHDFRISYVLALTVFLMVSGTAFLHSTISAIAGSIMLALSVGYVGALTLNRWKKAFINNLSKILILER